MVITVALFGIFYYPVERSLWSLGLIYLIGRQTVVYWHHRSISSVDAPLWAVRLYPSRSSLVELVSSTSGCYLSVPPSFIQGVIFCLCIRFVCVSYQLPSRLCACFNTKHCDLHFDYVSDGVTVSLRASRRVRNNRSSATFID